MDPTLEPFFHPRGVVVVGASQDPSKLGYGLARNLLDCGYQGGIHLVNPSGGALFGLPLYPDVASVPEPADLAVLIVPAPVVPEALRQCAQRGVKAAVIVSGGFREAGAEGEELEQECLRIAREGGLRLLGPNCIGVLDTHLPLDTTFLARGGLRAGEVAFVSHSGAICAAVVEWAEAQGFGLSRLVSLGNQADVTETDVLSQTAADTHTRVVTLYLEGVGDGRRFVREAAAATRSKPVIALKAGRSPGGRKAASSHTGALAGQEETYDAAFRRAGVLRAADSEELFEWACALSWCPPPAGRGFAVLTNAGGPGVLAADAVEACGLRLARPSDSTESSLRAMLPGAASIGNPVDILASASPELYAACLRLLLDDPQVDGVIVVLPPPPRFSPESVAAAIAGVARGAAKPVAVALMGERTVRRAAELLRDSRIPAYRSPEAAASAMSALARWGEIRARSPVDPFPPVQGGALPGEVARLLAGAGGQGGALDQAACGRILSTCGIRVLPVELAGSAHEAVEIAERLGYPVALKVASPDIPHKSDAGGVALGLHSPTMVSKGFERICANAGRALPEARIAGVHVQRMARSGQEVIVGAVQDPQFGPLVMFGSGGVEAEQLRDVAFELAPVAPEDAERMVEGTWAGRRLRGHRGLPPADRGSVISAIMAMARLVAQHPAVAEIEINPLVVLEPGGGAVAVDVRARLRAQD